MIIWQHSSWMIISADVILLHPQLAVQYLSLAFGPEVFAQFLEGAAEDRPADSKEDVLENPAMLDALIGVYERNVLGYPCNSRTSLFPGIEPFPGTSAAG